MKILQIRFQNLNSLVGEWSIDLTHSSFASSGIFAIVGPTGSGKTTILDAICLALYGQTPRLGKITGQSNDIMSRATGECFAEVLFKVQAGVFRSFWHQRRAHKKSEGKLQEAAHEVSCVDTGEILSSRLSESKEKIEELCGMNYEQFMRAVLLAQGDFAAFLKAEPSKKSELLEKITNSEIYGEISKKVQRRKAEEENRLKDIERNFSSISLLDSQKENEIQLVKVTKEEQRQEIHTEIERYEKAIQWLEAIKTLGEHIRELDAKAAAIDLEIEAFEPSLKKLERANQAFAIKGYYGNLQTSRQRLSREEKELSSWEAQKKEAEPLWLALIKNKDAVEKKRNEIKLELSANIPLFHEVRDLDRILHEQRNVVSNAEDEYQKAKREILKVKKERAECLSRIEQAKISLADTLAYLEDHQQEEWLINGLSGIEEQFKNLITRENEVKQKRTLRQQYAEELKALKEKIAKKSQLLAVERKNGEVHEGTILQREERIKILLEDRHFSEYLKEMEYLQKEKNFQEKILRLEDERQQLQMDKPCPLCGSLHHPYVKEHLPSVNETDLKIQKIQEKLQAIEELKKEIEESKKLQNVGFSQTLEIEKKLFELQSEFRSLESKTQELEGDINRLVGTAVSYQQELILKLRLSDSEDLTEQGIQNLRLKFKKTVNALLEHQKIKVRKEEELKECSTKIEYLESTLISFNKNILERGNSLSALTQKFKNQEIQRMEKFGDKKPDEEEYRLNNLLANVEEKQRSIAKQYEDLQGKKHEIDTRIKTNHENIDKFKEELKLEEDRFSKKIFESGFLNEEDFKSAQISVEQQELLMHQKRELEKQKEGIIAQKKAYAKDLELEKVKQLTTHSFVELEDLLHLQKEKQQSLQKEIIELSIQLDTNEQAKKILQGIQENREKQKKEYERWAQLYTLIGHSDGVTYRNFAQSLTLDAVIRQANYQLCKMTDRYILVRDSDELLALNVIDNYQAGEVRTIKNLSGGESFVISLALALGLSNMASKNMKIESLFLDEGFGTLDEDALDMALDALVSLQKEGKLIGIISHVSLLKERIDTQIQVIPLHGGRSILKGAGCL